MIRFLEVFVDIVLQILGGTTEVGVTVYGVGQGGRGCPYLGENLRGGGSGGSVVWVGDVDDDTAHWVDSGRIPSQGGPQADRVATS